MTLTPPDNDASLAGRYGITGNALAAWLLSRGQGELLALTPAELQQPLKAPACPSPTRRIVLRSADGSWTYGIENKACQRLMLYRPDGWACYEHDEAVRLPLGMKLQAAPELIDFGDGDGLQPLSSLSLRKLLALTGATIEAEYSRHDDERRASWKLVVSR